MDDDELIARLAGGDDVALRELFTRHAPVASLTFGWVTAWLSVMVSLVLRVCGWVVIGWACCLLTVLTRRGQPV